MTGHATHSKRTFFGKQKKSEASPLRSRKRRTSTKDNIRAYLGLIGACTIASFVGSRSLTPLTGPRYSRLSWIRSGLFAVLYCVTCFFVPVCTACSAHTDYMFSYISIVTNTFRQRSKKNHHHHTGATGTHLLIARPLMFYVTVYVGLSVW